MPTKVKELLALIEADGRFQVRQRGSHRQYHRPNKAGTVTVSGKPSVEVPPGTLSSVLKQAGLKKSGYSCSIVLLSSKAPQVSRPMFQTFLVE